MKSIYKTTIFILLCFLFTSSNAQGNASLLNDPSINEFQINDFDKYYNQAEVAYEKEDFALATILYTKCIMIQPENSCLYYSRAFSMWSIDEPNKNEHFYRDLHLIILDFNRQLLQTTRIWIIVRILIEILVIYI